MIRDEQSFVDATSILESRSGDDQELAVAQAKLEELRKDYSDDPLLANAFGRLYRRLRQFGCAFDAFSRAKELSDIRDYCSPWLNLGIFYEQFGMWGKAQVLYEHVLANQPHHDVAQSRQYKCEKQRGAIAASYGLAYPPVASGERLLFDTIEILLAADVTIKHVKHRVTDHLRQAHEVDILCEANVLPGQPAPLVIECKDWSRRIDRPVIDAFRGLLDHSAYRLGMIVASSGFTEPARREAEGSGIIVKRIDELEKDMEIILKTRLRSWCVECVIDYSAGPLENELKRRARSSSRLLQSVSEGHLPRGSGIEIAETGITVKGHQILWFERGECSCYQKVLGVPEQWSAALMLLYISWWNSVTDAAKWL